MTTVKNDIHAISSAADGNETVTTGKLAAHDAADAPARGADNSRKLTEQTFDQLIADSVQVSQNAVRQFNRNCQVMVQVGAVGASGYQSFLSEWSDYARHAARRNVQFCNEVRNPRTRMDVQEAYLKEGMQGLLSVGARVSELSAQVAHEMVGKLSASTVKTVDSLPRG